MSAANRAVALDPQNVRAAEAQMLVQYFSGSKRISLQAGSAILSPNPNDAETLADFGTIVAFAGDQAL